MPSPFNDALASAPVEPSLGSVGAGPFGLDAGARDPFAPPSLVGDQTTQGPIPTIEQIQQESINPLQLDFQDPTNIFSPASGEVAERFRGLQSIFGADMADEAPLTGMQIFALTLASISNPDAVQEVLRARRERRDQNSRDRRELNSRLLDVAANSVAQEHDLRLSQERLKINLAEANSLAASRAKQNALADIEMAKTAEETAALRRQNHGIGGSVALPPGFEPTGVTIGGDGRATHRFGPADTMHSRLTNRIDKLRPRNPLTGLFQDEGISPATVQEALRVEEADPTLTTIQRNELRAAARYIEMGYPAPGPSDLSASPAQGLHAAQNPGGINNATLGGLAARGPIGATPTAAPLGGVVTLEQLQAAGLPFELLE